MPLPLRGSVVNRKGWIETPASGGRPENLLRPGRRKTTSTLPLCVGRPGTRKRLKEKSKLHRIVVVEPAILSVRQIAGAANDSEKGFANRKKSFPKPTGLRNQAACRLRSPHLKRLSHSKNQPSRRDYGCAPISPICSE